jgi:hypothetical protein
MLDYTTRGIHFEEVYGPVVRLQNELNDWSAAQTLGELWVKFPATGQETFLFSKAPRVMLGPTQAPVERILGLSPEIEFWVL